MDLFDFFFPEQAQAAHLRDIARSKRYERRTRIASSDHSAEIADLRDDVNFLSMVLTAILKRLTETETMTVADVQDILDEIDRLDGRSDSGLDPLVLRGMLGSVKSASEPASAIDENNAHDEFRIDSIPRYRKT